jgi:hypothetical protein
MANISTMGRTSYALTATDILNGFAAVPVLWDTPFNDTNYNLSWSIHDTYFSAPSLDFGVGDVHYKTGSGFTAVVTLPAAAPIVQGQYDAFNVNTPQTDTFTPLAPTMYQVTVYLDPRGDVGSPLDSLQAYISYTDASGVRKTLAPADAQITRQGAPEGNTYPIWSNDAGSTIVVSTAFLTTYIPGTYLAATNYAVGTYVSGSFTYGATITQANSGAMAKFYGYVSGNIVYLPLTGVDDFASNWSDGAHTFTNGGGSTSSPSGFYNTNATIVQSVSGATYITQNSSGTANNDMYVGSGTGNPDNTHAWIDNSIFAVYIPSGVPSSLNTFHYDLSVRIVQMPSNSEVPAPGATFTVEAMASHR